MAVIYAIYAPSLPFEVRCESGICYLVVMFCIYCFCLCSIFIIYSILFCFVSILFLFGKHPCTGLPLGATQSF